MFGSCKGCAAFKIMPNAQSKGELVKQCRRHAPVIMAIVVGPGQATLTSAWPMTDEAQGCCEWTPMLSS